MIGAIAGDVIGSIYEASPIKTKEFPLFGPHCRFTDDSVLTIAVAEAILKDRDYRRWVWEIGRRYPHAGYGGNVIHCLGSKKPEPYNSWGNGAAMRVSPVGWAFDSIDDVLREAALTAEISHTRPEGIKGAQATALAVFLARTTRNKTLIKKETDDLVAFSFSGHGIRAGAKSFLLTYYAEMGALTDTALAMDRVTELITAVKSKNRLFIIDACRNDPQRKRYCLFVKAHKVLKTYSRFLSQYKS